MGVIRIERENLPSGEFFLVLRAGPSRAWEKFNSHDARLEEFLGFNYIVAVNDESVW